MDRSRIFVGSFNLDPRSARLNTEMGVVLESATLATQLSSALDTGLPGKAYAVALTADGKLEWIDGPSRVDSEPGAGFCAASGSDFCRSCRSSGCCEALAARRAGVQPVSPSQSAGTPRARATSTAVTGDPRLLHETRM